MVDVQGYIIAKTMAANYATAQSSANSSILLTGGTFSGHNDNVLTGFAFYAGGANSFVIGRRAEYHLTGCLYAKDGTVEVAMAENSALNGWTRKQGDAGIVNITMEDASEWNIANDSSLTNLTLHEGTTLNFSVNGDDFSTNVGNSGTELTLENINFAEDGVSISLDMGGYTGEALVVDSRIKLVHADWYSGGKIRFRVIGYDLAEGLEWDWSDFTTQGIVSVKAKAIPEPEAVVLSLLFLLSCCAAGDEINKFRWILLETQYRGMSQVMGHPTFWGKEQWRRWRLLSNFLPRKKLHGLGGA